MTQKMSLVLEALAFCLLQQIEATLNFHMSPVQKKELHTRVSFHQSAVSGFKGLLSFLKKYGIDLELTRQRKCQLKIENVCQFFPN